MDPVSHPGFSGRIREAKSSDQSRPIGLSAQIPLRPFPYYADAISEVAFIMPTLKPSTPSDSALSIRSTESSDSGQETTSLSSHPGDLVSSMQPPMKDTRGSGVSESAVIAEGSAMTSRRHSSKPEIVGLDTPRSKRGAVPQDCAAIVVWLEKFEDHLKFPLETMSGVLHCGGMTGSQKCVKKGLPVVFIHMLSSGLFQIVTRNPNSRCVCSSLHFYTFSIAICRSQFLSKPVKGCGANHDMILVWPNRFCFTQCLVFIGACGTLTLINYKLSIFSVRKIQ